VEVVEDGDKEKETEGRKDRRKEGKNRIKIII
jgi:hypothetical protein